MAIIRPGNFIYHGCEYVANYDGDTIDFNILANGYDFGFGITVHAPVKYGPIRVRLYGADTYELRGGTEETKEKARLGKEFVENVLTSAKFITIETLKDEKGSFGRYLAKVYYVGPLGDPEVRDVQEMFFLNRELIDRGLTTGRYEEVWEE